MNTNHIHPLRDLVLGVKVLPPAKRGLIHTLEGSREDEGLVSVRVLKFGPGGILPNGQRMKPDFRVGDLLLVDRFAIYNVEMRDGEKYAMVKESDVQAVVEQDEVEKVRCLFGGQRVGKTMGGVGR